MLHYIENRVNIFERESFERERGIELSIMNNNILLSKNAETMIFLLLFS